MYITYLRLLGFKSFVEPTEFELGSGRTLGVIGTPNFFINGKLYKSTFDLPQLKVVIDPLIAGGGQVASPARS